jgi:hypothetical protein
MDGTHWETWRRQWVEFSQDLQHDDDALSIIRGHLHLEVMLGELLAVRFPGAEHWLEFVQFADKVKLARREELINKEYARALTTIGNLRNSFAHPPIKRQLTEIDKAEFLKPFRAIFERHNVKYPAGESGGQLPLIMHKCFGMLHGHLDGKLIIAKDGKRYA